MAVLELTYHQMFPNVMHGIPETILGVRLQ